MSIICPRATKACASANAVDAPPFAASQKAASNTVVVVVVVFSKTRKTQQHERCSNYILQVGN